MGRIETRDFSNRILISINNQFWIFLTLFTKILKGKFSVTHNRIRNSSTVKKNIVKYQTLSKVIKKHQEIVSIL